MKRSIIGLLVTALIVGGSAPADAYLKLGARVAGRTVTLRWGTFPVRYFVTDPVRQYIEEHGLYKSV